MALFPQQFLDDLKSHADIVTVIQDYVSLKKSGANYKGLCPFHSEKTPSFQVNRDKGFFNCFGCGAAGDVIKFLELHDKVGFLDAVKLLAQRFGLAVPEPEQSDEQRAGSLERETLLKVHEAAAVWFREQLLSPAGARIRAQVAERGVNDATAEALRLGFAPPSRDGLKNTLVRQGFAPQLLVRAGLLFQRDDGETVDRFRNRLIIPICRDSGAVIAFGGRSVDRDQQPKYLNSPETPIYTKGRTLYGLNLSKAAIRQAGFAVMVEGYFDFAQVYQAGHQTVVASCGTALTTQQAQQLRRFTTKVVLSFDPDTAGQSAAAKSCEMLANEGFEVNVAVLPAGGDPDTFIRKNGGGAYRERLRRSQPYLEYLLDRAAAAENLTSDEGRARLVNEMLPVLARVADRVRRDLFVEAVAGKARVSADLVHAELRKLGPSSQTVSEAPRPPLDFGQVTKAEKGLIWWLINEPGPALAALATLEPEDIDAVSSRSVLDLARKLNEDRGFSPSVLLERLSLVEAQLVATVASEGQPPVHDVDDCARDIRRLRCERDYAALQQEIDRVQRLRDGQHDNQMHTLLERKRDLLQRIAGLKFSTT